MTPRAPHVIPVLATGRANPLKSLKSWRTLTAIGLIALSTAGCLKHGSPDVTGSLATPQQTTPEAWRQHVETWGPRFDANPTDVTAALQCARPARVGPEGAGGRRPAAGGHPQPEECRSTQPTARSCPRSAGTRKRSEVLSKAHTPEHPDWRILQQGAVADQTGDHELAQNYYEAALKLAPGEPSVLSNLGLSYALSKRLQRRSKRSAMRPTIRNPTPGCIRTSRSSSVCRASSRRPKPN